MITSTYSLTATERVLPSMMLDFTTAITDARVVTTRANNTATRTNASGVLEIVNANLPRYDFNPSTLICRGQLIEEPRTNLFLNSLINGTNLTTQSVTLAATSYALSFYGSGSIVISGGHSATVSGAGAYPTRTTYVFTPTAGSSTFTVSGTVQYAQIEAGAFATSFIPTAGTSALRNGDAVEMSGTNFSSWFNATEGTFVANAETYYALGFGNRVFWCRNTATATYNDAIYMDTRRSQSRWQAGVRANGADQFVQDLLTAASPSTAALAYKASSFAAAINGGSAISSSSGTVPTVNAMRIGSHTDGTFLNGYMRKLMFYPQRLINAEVTAFSK